MAKRKNNMEGGREKRDRASRFDFIEQTFFLSRERALLMY